MPLTERQKRDLNIAILDYLRDNGYNDTLETFTRESQLEPPSVSIKILERKWTAVVRLTTKMAKLEKQLSTTEIKLKKVQPFDYSDFIGSKKLYDEVIPNTQKFLMRGHQKAVNRVLFHPTYSWMVSCGDDAKIGVWDYETGKPYKWLRGHTNNIHDIAFNANGTLLASCSADMSVKVWNFDDEFRCIKTLNGHDHSVTGVCFLKLHESSDLVISCSRDGTVKFWDIESGYCTKTLADAHDGEWVKKIILSYDSTLLATCSVDQTVRVFNCKNQSIQTIEQVQVFRGHEHVIENIRFSQPNADQYILGTNTGGAAGTPRNNSNNNNSGGSASAESKANTYDSDLESDDSDDYADDSGAGLKPPRFIASASRDKNICIWDIQTGTRVMLLKGHENWVRSLVFHPCGRFLISSADDKSIRFWDLSKQRLHSKMDDAHKGFIASIDWHPKLSLLASGCTSRDVRIWHYDQKKETIIDF